MHDNNWLKSPYAQFIDLDLMQLWRATQGSGPFHFYVSRIQRRFFTPQPDSGCTLWGVCGARPDSGAGIPASAHPVPPSQHRHHAPRG